jgi:hypothetical protein
VYLTAFGMSYRLVTFDSQSLEAGQTKLQNILDIDLYHDN